jgi:hypothetical protein
MESGGDRGGEARGAWRSRERECSVGEVALRVRVRCGVGAERKDGGVQVEEEKYPRSFFRKSSIPSLYDRREYFLCTNLIF